MLDAGFVAGVTYYGCGMTLPWVMGLLDEEAVRWDLSKTQLTRAKIFIRYFLNPLFWGSLALLQVLTKHWFIDNLFAISISVVAIKEANLKSFRVALGVLWLLLIYDLYWVYGT